MSKNSRLDEVSGGNIGQTSTAPPTSDNIEIRIIEIDMLLNILKKRRDELQKAKAGQQNLELLTGKDGGEPYGLDKMNWKESNYKPGSHWIGKEEVPEPIKKLSPDKFPITSSNYKYYLTTPGNLTRYPI